MSFNNIPEELKAISQWLVWSYEDTGAEKPTKIPYNAKNGRLAATNEPATWCTFNEAVIAAKDYSGIGFVFTNKDRYSFIDLDDTKGDQILLNRQIEIYREFDSYSEVSPSGKGLHIIVKGNVPTGRRRSFIEVYSSGRYATFTGNAYNNKPIVDCQDKLTALWQQMGEGQIATYIYGGDVEQKNDDPEIINQASNASNGDKFKSLFAGEWQSFYPSQSEADLAFIDIVAFYTQNKKQIIRIFLQSGLGKRDKAKRQDYMNWMINKSFDKMLPQLDFDGFRNALELKLLQQREQLAEALDLPHGSVAQRLVPTAHNGSDVGSNPAASTTTLREQNVYDRSEEASFIFQETLRKQQTILFYQKCETQECNKYLVTKIQNESQMLLLFRNSSGLFRISSFGPDTEGSNSFICGKCGLVNTEINERNREVYHTVQQLSSKAALQNKAGSTNGKSVAFEAITGSNPGAASIPLPPGLLGEIAQFIYAIAPRPVHEIALAGAIGLMAGICGRAYNISGTGLNQYILMLADTGSGKEAAAIGIDKLMNTIRLQVPTSSSFIGPSEIASGQALIKHLSKTSQCFVSILGEFGLRLETMSSDRANSAERALKRMLLDLFNKSGHGQLFRPSIFADAEKNISATESPSFSILGESTPERFYGVLNEEMIAEGLLPRFMLIEYNGPRPPLNENHVNVVPSFQLQEKLASLVANVETIMHAKKVLNVHASEEAALIFKSFDKYCDTQINGTSQEILRQLWNRAHVKALKLSALIAVGINMYNPVIVPAYVLWAIDMVQNDITALSRKFEMGEIGTTSSEAKQQKEVIKAIKEFLTRDWSHVTRYCQGKNVELMYNAKLVPYTFLHRRLFSMAAFRNDRQGATAALKRCIQNMVDGDMLREVNRKDAAAKYGTSQRAYVLSDLKLLD